MYVVIGDKRIPFWGARAVSLDANSPLRKLGMVEGDVLTRLDGNTLNIEKFEDGGIWQIPELDRHYGLTDVKWIKQGTHQVNLGQVDLDSAGAAEPTVLSSEFEISLLPGFSHQRRQGIDSLWGILVHKDGRRIDYEIGTYYPPAVRPTVPSDSLPGSNPNSTAVGGEIFLVAHGAPYPTPCCKKILKTYATRNPTWQKLQNTRTFHSPWTPDAINLPEPKPTGGRGKRGIGVLVNCSQ